MAERLRRREDDERGAELVEFAFVIILLLGLLYGIISYGLILAAQSTITQAAADGARSGIVQGTGTTACGNFTVSAAACAAVQQAASDLSWMSKGTCKEVVQTVGTGTPVTSTPNTTTIVLSSSSPITCTGVTGGCPSNTTNLCLLVRISYAYSTSPLFPLVPGLKEATPSTLSSSNVLQISTPSGS